MPSPDSPSSDRGDRPRDGGPDGPIHDAGRMGGYQGRGGSGDKRGSGDRRGGGYRGPGGPVTGERTAERRFRDPEEVYFPKPGTAAAADEPETPEGYDPKALPFAVRAEMKGLPKDLAETVGAHILAAGELIDVDPELAYKHAEAARRRAGRLPVVREAAAETAYASGHFDVALREYRAIRRMNGGDELIPVMADCERALGKPREALELLATAKTQDAALRVECLLVEAGARDDLGQRAEALRILKSAISGRLGSRESQARLSYAYANLLEQSGQTEAAIQWFDNASELDTEGELPTADRIAALQGVTLPDSMELEANEPEDAEEQPVANVTEPGTAPAGSADSVREDRK